MGKEYTPWAFFKSRFTSKEVADFLRCEKCGQKIG
ncbi:Hypothetical protein AJF4211_001950 [Avibacterium paragallinarum JF4211]|nr:Hypothetical protein AJF4211_001950 [Avibacterium paragallinarum JF4211]